jgi:hypothetical protein
MPSGYQSNSERIAIALTNHQDLRMFTRWRQSARHASGIEKQIRRTFCTSVAKGDRAMRAMIAQKRV